MNIKFKLKMSIAVMSLLFIGHHSNVSGVTLEGFNLGIRKRMLAEKKAHALTHHAQLHLHATNDAL